MSRPLGRALDSFVEAQIHGSISLRHDVEQLVVDPVFRDTEVGDSLDRICSTWGIEVGWHPGYRLRISDVPETFRGWQTARLAARIEPDPGGWIDAAKIGAGQRLGVPPGNGGPSSRPAMMP